MKKKEMKEQMLFWHALTHYLTKQIAEKDPFVQTNDDMSKCYWCDLPFLPPYAVKEQIHESSCLWLRSKTAFEGTRGMHPDVEGKSDE